MFKLGKEGCGAETTRETPHMPPSKTKCLTASERTGRSAMMNLGIQCPVDEGLFSMTPRIASEIAIILPLC